VAYYLAAFSVKTPGLSIHMRIAIWAARLFLDGRISRGEFYELAFCPMDSFRYFEFSFAWKALTEGHGRRYLDVSSPRLFPTLFMKSHRDIKASMLNPDPRDLELTRKFLAQCGLDHRITLEPRLIDQANFERGSFDLISSISVVEHIENDLEAVRQIWDLLAEGGTLVITIPCAAAGFDEYIDMNEYGILPTNEDGFSFGQRFYDSNMLRDRIFSVTGTPDRQEIFGEKAAGTFFAMRQSRLSAPLYPFWKEPYRMGDLFGRFEAIDKLPGIGVIGMEFHKRPTRSA
jgi:SAM-dependent methyltransferase